MKTFTRIGAVLSFTSFVIPAVWLLSHANGRDEPLAIIIGFCLLGIAFFVGPILWLTAEKCCSK